MAEGSGSLVCWCIHCLAVIVVDIVPSIARTDELTPMGMAATIEEMTRLHKAESPQCEARYLYLGNPPAPELKADYERLGLAKRREGDFS